MQYQINDGRVWSVAAAQFVEPDANAGHATPLYNGADEVADAAYLRQWLESGGYPIGQDLYTLQEAKQAKLAEVLRGYADAFAPIEAMYPAMERETWPIQLEEARAVLGNPDADAPMLSILVQARGNGESLAEFAQVVMHNNAMYRQLAGYLTGQQQRMYAEVSSMQDIDAIRTYEPRYAMPDGLAYGGA